MNPERRAALFTPGKTSGHRVGQAAQGCNHWCTLHNNSLYPFPTWEAIMSCLTKTCCDKKLDNPVAGIVDRGLQTLLCVLGGAGHTPGGLADVRSRPLGCLLSLADDGPGEDAASLRR